MKVDLVVAPDHQLDQVVDLQLNPCDGDSSLTLFTARAPAGVGGSAVWKPLVGS